VRRECARGWSGMSLGAEAVASPGGRQGWDVILKLGNGESSVAGGGLCRMSGLRFYNTVFARR